MRRRASVFALAMTALLPTGVAIAAPASTSSTAPPAKVDPTAERSIAGSAKPFAGKARPNGDDATATSGAASGSTRMPAASSSTIAVVRRGTGPDRTSQTAPK